ncbi:MAG: NADH:flavin oxidoreductase [Candidatus Aminicenantes bacterium]|nr:MAG: NADH:flavin oxidoreductase [Candidatus Aminicenantes bacterium]
MINEQRSASKGNSGYYPHVLSKFEIGPVSLRNRVVFPAWQLNYANTDGTVSEKLMKFHTDLAKGGCGLIFTGAAVVTSDGIPFDRVMHVDTDDHIPGLEKLFAAIKEYGAAAGIQIVHYGRQSSSSVSGGVLRAPSAIPCPVMSQYDPEYKVREMTGEDIDEIREAFIAAAERGAKAGADIVEVHACHGYLLNEFLSPYSNKRTDAYGGSVENRARLIVEILEGIGERLKNYTNVAVCLRVSGDEFVEGGLKPGDFKEFVPLFEKAGMQMLNVSAGVYESMERIVPPKKLGIAPHADIAAQIKQFTSVPVCTVGSIIGPGLEVAESIIAEGKADLCAMGRAQMADPELVKKSAEARESEIRQCIHDNACTFWTTGDPEVYCSVNPDYKKE